jgi:hypothetical protein
MSKDNCFPHEQMSTASTYTGSNAFSDAALPASLTAEGLGRCGFVQ